MKMHIFRLFFFCAIALLQFSCTSQLHIQTIRPAKVKIANDQWKVMVVNRFNPELLSLEEEEEVRLYKEGAQEAFYGVIDAIMEDSTYFLAHIDTIHHLAQKLNDSLSMDQLHNIYQQYPYHLLLSLDHFDVGLEQEIVNVEHEDGSVSKAAYYTLVTTSSWSLYDSLGHLLDKVSLSLEELYDSRSALSGLLTIEPSIEKVREQVNELAWFTGYNYWKRLYPQAVTYKRPYFYRGKLEAAGYRMTLDDWQGAIAILKPIAESGRKEAGKAAFNLAVVYEAMGLIDEARYWAMEASRKNVVLAFLLLEDLGKY